MAMELEVSIFPSVCLAFTFLVGLSTLVYGAVLTKRRRTGGHQCMALGAVIIVVSVILLPGEIRRYRSPAALLREIAYPYVAQPLPAVDEVRVPVVEARAGWDLGEGEFEANVYASRELAGKAAALGVVKSLATIAPGGEEGLTVGLAGDLASDAIGEAVRGCEARVGRVVRLEGSPSTQPAVVLSVAVVAEGSYGVNGVSGRNGTVTALLRGPGGEASRSAEFDEKVWNDDFARFVNRNPEGRWYLAQSRSPATTVREAEELAFEDAARQLLPYFRSEVHTRCRLEATDAVLMEVILAALRRGLLIHDRFVQRMDRPYGQVWREMLLVNAQQKDVLHSIGLGSALFERSPAAEAWHKARVTRFSAVGMAVLIVAVYLFLNAATKGYYAWSLRIAAAVLALAGVALVLALA